MNDKIFNIWFDILKYLYFIWSENFAIRTPLIYWNTEGSLQNLVLIVKAVSKAAVTYSKHRPQVLKDGNNRLD